MTTFADRLMAELHDPEDIAQPEYRAAYDLVMEVLDGAANDFGQDDEPMLTSERIYDSLDLLILNAQDCKQAVTRALRA